jgi:hypothetical protein
MSVVMIFRFARGIEAPVLTMGMPFMIRQILSTTMRR